MPRVAPRTFLLAETDTPLIEKLTPRHQEILALEGSQLTAIAAALSLNIGTVKSRQHRARAALKVLRAPDQESQP